MKPAEEIEEEDTEGVDLYKGSFSLVCCTLTLLRGTKMHLKHNGFCGLLRPSQCGTTTLMRAIVNEQLEGFPKRDELKSCRRACGGAHEVVSAAATLSRDAEPGDGFLGEGLWRMFATHREP